MMQQNFTIRDLSQLTRIKPHTLRIWEQRYGIMNPQRTDSNIRLYSQEDLKFLLNVSILYDYGLKISNIAKLSLEELNQKVKQLASEKKQIPAQIQNLVVSMLELDEERFEKQLNNSIMSIGLEETIFYHQSNQTKTDCGYRWNSKFQAQGRCEKNHAIST
jgi:DNA-binding transcriptional MerR regulator